MAPWSPGRAARRDAGRAMTRAVDEQAPAAAPDRAASVLPAEAVLRSVTSESLLRGQRQLVIRHGADEYRLRVTQGGKLILTK